MDKLSKLTRTDWDAIKDALEMRHREACDLRREMEEANQPRLALKFQHILERANATLTKLEELEIV